jgi:hypothetical protein
MKVICDYYLNDDFNGPDRSTTHLEAQVLRALVRKGVIKREEVIRSNLPYNQRIQYPPNATRHIIYSLDVGEPSK